MKGRTSEGHTAAVIGLGAMGRHHLRILSELPQVAHVAGCEVSEERRAAMGAEFPKATLYGHVAAMLEKERPALVSIATLGPTHIDLAGACLNAGVKHILVEKPAGVSVGAIRELAKAAARAKAHVAINHSRRACGDYLHIAPWLEKIGGVRGIALLSGGGRLGSVGTHYFDAMRMITKADFTAVSGYLDPAYAGDHKGRDIWDPGGVGVYEMSGGVRVHVDLTDDLGFPPLLILYGPFGRLLLNENAKSWVCEARSAENRAKRLGEYGTPLVREDIALADPIDMVAHTRKMIEALLEGKVLCTLEDGAAAVEAVVGFHLAHQRKTKIALPLKGQDAALEVKIT
jgi:predicted dehydrogenase